MTHIRSKRHCQSGATGTFGWANAWIPAEQLIEQTQPILRGTANWWADRFDEHGAINGSLSFVAILGEWLGRSVATDVFTNSPIADCSLTAVWWKFD